MTDAQSASATPTIATTPLGVSIASTLAILLGVLTLLSTVSRFGPAVGYEAGAGWLMAIGVSTGLGAVISGVLIRKRKKVGVLILALAWALPVFFSLLAGEQPTGNILLTAVLLLSAANWKSLR